MFPWHQIAHVGVSQSRGLRLFGREIILEEFQPMSSRYLIVTDRRTDRRTGRQTKAISIPRYALVHRAVKTDFGHFISLNWMNCIFRFKNTTILFIFSFCLVAAARKI